MWHVSEYNFEFESDDICYGVANEFHEELRGNDDYINDNIVLNFHENRAHLYIYPESKTRIEIHDGPHGPLLRTL